MARWMCPHARRCLLAADVNKRSAGKHGGGGGVGNVPKDVEGDGGEAVVVSN